METIQDLDEMIRPHERAMMKAEERNAVLASEKRDLLRSLGRVLIVRPAYLECHSSLEAENERRNLDRSDR
jgi:hypothetical protein